MFEDKLIITEYEIGVSCALSCHFTIGLVADLHEHDPSELLSLLKETEPDLIMVAGDTLERNDKRSAPSGGQEPPARSRTDWRRGIRGARQAAGTAVRFTDKILRAASRHGRQGAEDNGRMFLRKACEIAPVFMSVGNHEWYFLPEDYETFRESGAVLLDNDDRSVSISGADIRIGGLSTRCDPVWLKEFSKKDGFKILICHHPEYYLRHIKGYEPDGSTIDTFDLILSGHCHGGQWRIGGRGIYAPGQGLFPAYTHGVYDTGRGKLIISAGVSNTVAAPRFGNPRELVIIDVTLG